jgi:hypothetical protein
MRKIILSFLIIFFPALAFAQSSQVQTQGNQQPLNASVSDFGTSFIFSAPPICPGCVETEFGFLSLEDGRFLPIAVSVAPFGTHTDFSVLVNVLDSEVANGKRITQFGNRFDFVIRQQVYAKGEFVFTIAPRGTLFSRSVDGGRAGATLAAQYGKGNNLGIANLTFTKAINSSFLNQKNDYQGSLDYYRTLTGKGVAVFAGVQHEVATGKPQIVSIEQGLVLPFQNGQVEVATEQLDLNIHPTWQFQVRVIVNWGKLIRKK